MYGSCIQHRRHYILDLAYIVEIRKKLQRDRGIKKGLTYLSRVWFHMPPTHEIKACRPDGTLPTTSLFYAQNRCEEGLPVRWAV